MPDHKYHCPVFYKVGKTGQPASPEVVISLKGLGKETVPDNGNGDEGTTPPPDADGDTVADVGDNCPKNANADQADTDADGTGDACDPTPNGDFDVAGGTNEPPPVLATEDGSSSEDSGGGGGGGCSLVR